MVRTQHTNFDEILCTSHRNSKTGSIKSKCFRWLGKNGTECNRIVANQFAGKRKGQYRK